MEVEARGATVLLRALPLQPRAARPGALVLVRDVTEVRRRDRALLTKDATIREIHHRVKNNLQTVAALLRLQARRVTEPRGRAAALEESVRRVALDRDRARDAGRQPARTWSTSTRSLDRVLPMLGDAGARSGRRRAVRRGRLVRRAAGGGGDAAGRWC